jgi:rhodanese-related sulfurtransferase
MPKLPAFPPALVASLSLVAVALLSCSADPASLITPEELSQRLASGDPPFILDVRTPEEFASGHVPGAVNIPHTELAARLGEIGLPRSSEIVVHCERGGRAGVAEAVLTEAGFENVRDLSGHMAAWRAADLPMAP